MTLTEEGPGEGRPHPRARALPLLPLPQLSVCSCCSRMRFSVGPPGLVTTEQGSAEGGSALRGSSGSPSRGCHGFPRGFFRSSAWAPGGRVRLWPVSSSCLPASSTVLRPCPSSVRSSVGSGRGQGVVRGVPMGLTPEHRPGVPAPQPGPWPPAPLRGWQRTALAPCGDSSERGPWTGTLSACSPGHGCRRPLFWVLVHVVDVVGSPVRSPALEAGATSSVTLGAWSP